MHHWNRWVRNCSFLHYFGTKLFFFDIMTITYSSNLIWYKGYYRDVSTGATGATAVAPKFSDTLTQSPPGDSAHHHRGCNQIFPVIMSLYVTSDGYSDQQGLKHTKAKEYLSSCCLIYILWKAHSSIEAFCFQIKEVHLSIITTSIRPHSWLIQSFF